MAAFMVGFKTFRILRYLDALWKISARWRFRTFDSDSVHVFESHDFCYSSDRFDEVISACFVHDSYSILKGKTPSLIPFVVISLIIRVPNMEENRICVILGHLSGHKEPLRALGVVNPHATAQSLYQKHRNKGFQYTLNNKKLSPEQRKFYEENGYLVLENLIPVTLLESLRLRFQEIREGKLPEIKPNDGLPTPKNDDLCKNAKGAFLNEVLTGYFTLPQVLDFIECFCGQNIVVQHCMSPVYDSSSGSSTSSQFIPTQDERNCAVYPINRAVCCWTSLQAADRASGYVTLCPGTHQIAKKGKTDTSKKIVLEMKPGDTLLYHPLLVHDFGSERYKDCRKAISCWYIASECHQRRPPQDPSTTPHQLVKGKRINL